jgi:YesN/AraC family two-component response regulator
MQYKHTLLFVDDEADFEPLIRQLLAKEISEGKYEVLYAQTGLEALEIILNDFDRKIDLVFTDLKMPGQTLDGFELIEKLRLKKIAIKIVVISAFGDFDNVRTSLKKHNVIDFITKSATSDFNLPYIVKCCLEQSENVNSESRNVRFQTLVKMVRELPSYRIKQLVENVLPSCTVEDLEQMRNLLVLENALEKAISREAEKPVPFPFQTTEIIEKLKSGEIDVNAINVDEFNSTHRGIGIYEKMLTRNGKQYGPYYHLHWFEDGKQKVYYLGKKKI